MKVKCINCGKSSSKIARRLEYCADCIRPNPVVTKEIVERVHAKSRVEFNLPPHPPKSSDGINCRICINECQIPDGGMGYCGLRLNKAGKLIHLGGTPKVGVVSWYFDLLPTNCVADWVCPAGSDSGYPEFSYRREQEYGYKNLAVFYGACSFNCLFCQNWHYRGDIERGSRMSAAELADCVDEQTACICYFGGDPTPQLPHAIATSRIALKQADGRILRICWETNGSMSLPLLKRMAQLSVESGGCIKFDLKAWSKELHIALTGASNEHTLENFKYLATLCSQRPNPPFLVASTLIVPGYVDVEEIRNLSKFIASLGQDIPYALLAFHPHFYMSDLPTTSRKQALACLEEAKEQGLTNVRIGNVHLLS